MKALPYFRWFPADAEIDENYAALCDAELGFFHRCLNRAWANDGLPADLDRLAATMRVTREYLDQVWPAVSKCFTMTDTVIPRYINPRQEHEREIVITKSRKSTEAVTIREAKRIVRSSNDERPIIERSSDDHPRARARADSDSDSVSSSSTVLEFQRKPEDTKPKPAERPSERFEEFWDRYPIKEQKNLVMGVWLSLVTIYNEAKVFACLDRYLASDRGQRSPKNGNNWLHDCALDKWESQWPKARDSPPTALRVDPVVEAAKRDWEERRKDLGR